MTEEEYQSLKPFEGLPLYDDSDPRCESIEKVDNPDYTGELFEADEVTLAYEYIHKSDLVPKGGIRHHGDDGSTVFAYYWRKR